MRLSGALHQQRRAGHRTVRLALGSQQAHARGSTHKGKSSPRPARPIPSAPVSPPPGHPPAPGPARPAHPRLGSAGRPLPRSSQPRPRLKASTLATPLTQPRRPPGKRRTSARSVDRGSRRRPGVRRARRAGGRADGREGAGGGVGEWRAGEWGEARRRGPGGCRGGGAPVLLL